MFYLPLLFVALGLPVAGDLAPVGDAPALATVCKCADCDCGDCGCLRGQPCTCGDDCNCSDCGCLRAASSVCGSDCNCADGCRDAACDCEVTGECRCGTQSACQCGPASCCAAR